MKTCNRISGNGVNFANELQYDLENILDHWMGGRQRQRRHSFTPRTNIVETETGFEVSVELPGLEKEDVNVEVADGNLSISGEKKWGEVEDNTHVHRQERCAGKFNRSFEFPVQVDFDKIEASFKAGVLTVSLPKSEKVLPRKIDVQVN